MYTQLTTVDVSHVIGLTQAEPEELTDSIGAR